MRKMFSMTEERILEVLGRKKMTVLEITAALYDIKRFPESRNTISNMIRRINLKCRLNNLDWYLNANGGGRHGKLVWKEKKV